MCSRGGELGCGAGEKDATTTPVQLGVQTGGDTTGGSVLFEQICMLMGGSTRTARQSPLRQAWYRLWRCTVAHTVPSKTYDDYTAKQSLMERILPWLRFTLNENAAAWRGGPGC